MVIAVAIDESHLQVLEDRQDVQIAIVVNEDINNVGGWLKLYDAKDATTNSNIMAGMVIHPLLNRTIGWLKHIANGSTPLHSFKRVDYLRQAANLLKKNNVTFDSDAVACQCIKRGLDAKSARAVANVFVQSLATKGLMTIKVEKTDYDQMLSWVDTPQFDNN